MIMFFLMIRVYFFILVFSIFFYNQVSAAEVIMPSTFSSFFIIGSGFGLRSANEWNYRLNIQRIIRSNEDFENSLDLSISKVF